ncbi:hypothetical protein DID88_005605 [Monilinia fructigena]|uniref:Carrier domain-containing protein n=1 Tax=Monilinia fructigena TaxID=38457 RepID=A0A395J1H2_9HELO|nr:hypothetical protein DID88_005605 [Monilinia fructigena]
MHTSGSTGTPKPIVVSQGVITSLDASQKVPSMYGLSTTSEHWRNLRCFLSFPLFHLGGVGRVMTALYFKQIAVLPPPVPLNARIANEVLVHGKVQAADLPPAVLVEISQGSRWDYFDFSTAFGVEMRHYSDELYEIVIVRDPSIEAYQGVFYTFADLSEYKTRDLFSKHPTKENLWRHEGRSDDIIVYSSGEKFNPISSMESHLGSHPEVKAAVVYGDKKFQSALLIEPVELEKSKEALLDELWPVIQSANANSPTHARIMSKDFVTFVTADKPLPRAGKGTVQRKMAMKLYEEELNSLYEEKYTGNPTNGYIMNGHIANENDHNPGGTNDDLQDTIIQALASLQGFEKISPSENWFELGMDSLGVISLARALNVAFRSHNAPQKSVSDSMIYTYPSPEKLASALSGAGKDKNGSQDEMKREYERYSFDLPIVAPPSTPIAGPKVFLLTGSTGSLGSYILNSLLAEDKSCKIYCLNRGEDSGERQRSSSSSKGLLTDFKRVEFLSMATGTEEPWLVLPISLSQSTESDRLPARKGAKGKWNEQEWFPLILRSSIFLGVLPSSLGPLEAVDWIPVDLLGKVIHELVSASTLQSQHSKLAINGSRGSAPIVYHVVNPKRTTYSDAILPKLEALMNLPTVSFEDWVRLLRDSAAKTRDVEINDNPGVKLLSFYEELVSMGKEGRSQVWLDTEKSVEGSLTLKNMDAIDGKCIDNWFEAMGGIFVM